MVPTKFEERCHFWWWGCIPRSALQVHNSLITHLSVAFRLAFNAWTSWSETRNNGMTTWIWNATLYWKKYRWFTNWDKYDNPILDSNHFAFGVFIEFSTFHNRSDMIGRCSPAGLSRRYHLRTWLTPRCVHMLHALSTSSWLDNFGVDTIWAQGYCI